MSECKYCGRGGKYEKNPSIDDNTLCHCGHVYYRHFDWMEDDAPVGCKYSFTCGCRSFINTGVILDD